jgi:uncharacterized heparinase superfamily protein
MAVSLSTYWRTVRHLKWQQVACRAAFRMRRPRADLRPAPPARVVTGPWQQPAQRAPSMITSSRFRFLNVERELHPHDWAPTCVDKLWLYNLHYFDDLNARAAPERLREHRKLVSDWINCNPPGVGTGWDPYPVSLRMVNWIKWLLDGVPAETLWLDSLAVQARWLCRRLEVHLLGNHLFANAKALIFSGLYFDGGEASSWLDRGLSILIRELDEQILSDGGHFERSPMYHALILEDVLDLINATRALRMHDPRLSKLTTKLQQYAPRMLSWLRLMTHPGGQLALFNDCADGIAPDFSELRRYALRLGVAEPSTGDSGEALVHLEESGFVRVTRGPLTALLDVAPIGPDYLPGHAHADTLSFEVSLGSVRLIANGGTSCYGDCDRRDYERSTSAHNTVEVGGESSSEVWSSFRVGRRARPRDLEISGWRIQCSHDGYRFLPGRPMHRRTWFFGERDLLVEDQVHPAMQATARYFLAPGLQFRQAGLNTWQVGDQSVCLALVRVSRGYPLVESVVQAHAFGIVEPVECLVLQLVEGEARTLWTWQQ